MKQKNELRTNIKKLTALKDVYKRIISFEAFKVDKELLEEFKKQDKPGSLKGAKEWDLTSFNNTIKHLKKDLDRRQAETNLMLDLWASS